MSSASSPLATLVWSLVVVIHVVVSTRHLVSTTRNGDLEMKMYVTVRTKRSEAFDFTEINRYVCPPSLCRSYDESTKSFKPRPRGTGGTIFYQGDIILDENMSPIIYKDDDDDDKRTSRKKRATMRPRRLLWKNGIVKYKFSKSISDKAREVIQEAIDYLQNKTCLRFEQKKKEDEDFIRFISEPGCWSQIGKVGGAQLVSLGKSCEKIGTAVHEIAHALGVWHEQARPDRNRYIKVLKQNVSPMFMPDFEKVDRVIASDRGYPYDYHSLMHYSQKAFTRNGRPTIEVIGKGKRLGLRIGQRKELSTIDLGQIRDMYKCNHKTDVEQKVCGKGWKKKEISCYKFFPKWKAQFGPAFQSCKDLKSHLLVIDNVKEQRYLDRYLPKKYPEVLSWRMAGGRVNDRMVWYLERGKIQNMTYTNWAKHNPRTQTSAILKRKKGDNKFKWFGEWRGSYSQKPTYEHAYICEKAAKRKCVRGNYADGRDYRGTLDYTRGGTICQKWTDNYPRDHPLREAAVKASETPDKRDENGLGDHNYCRNPSEHRRKRPWCFTAKKKGRWGYCDVSTCVKTVERFQKRQADLATRRENRRRVVGLRLRSKNEKLARRVSSSSSSLNKSSGMSSSSHRQRSRNDRRFKRATDYYHYFNFGRGYKKPRL